MIYSVYNYTTRRYDYYEGDGPKGAHAGKPSITRVRSELGATPEQAAWAVPSDATPIGSGDLPKGRVATLESKIDATSIALVAGGALLLWRLLR